VCLVAGYLFLLVVWGVCLASVVVVAYVDVLQWLPRVVGAVALSFL